MALSFSTLFETPPILFFAPEETICPNCGGALSNVKTQKRTVGTLTLGLFIAHETICSCVNPACDYIASSQSLSRLVPDQGTYGYDVIVFVGMKLLFHCRSEKDILSDLHQRNLPLPRSEIGVLARKFIVYLSIAHQQSQSLIRASMRNQGGYILHLDGTSEADSPHLMSVLDGLSEWVLGNAKLPSENADTLIPFLRRIKREYGMPIAVVHDLAKSILLAVKTVFPGVPDFLCHFHFLRDIGKDILSANYDLLRKKLRAHRVQAFLRNHARKLRPSIEKNVTAIEALETWLDKPTPSACLPADTPSPLTIAYVLIQWALDGKHVGDGYGFPFDRPHLSFYLRLCSIHETLATLRQTCVSASKGQKHLLTALVKGIHGTITDPLIKKTANQLKEKAATFDQLRLAMRIALPDDSFGLNDNGSGEMDSIRHRVIHFQKALSQKLKTNPDADYQKMDNQIMLYWDKLFADPIAKQTPCGPVKLYPQRTNNIMERFFRDIRRGHRKRSGTNTMTRTLKAILADTPLIANLRDPAYQTLLLNSATSLEERFSQIDVQLVRDKLRHELEENRLLSPKVKRIIKRLDLMKKITKIAALCQ